MSYANTIISPVNRCPIFTGLRKTVGTPVDLFLPFDGGAGALTVAGLGAVDYNDSYTGVWTLPGGDPSTVAAFAAAGALASLKSPITVNGVPYLGNGGCGLRCDYGAVGNIVIKRTIPNTDNLRVGIFFKCNLENDYAGLDVIQIQGNTGAVYGVLQYKSDATPLFRAHSEAGTGTSINVVKNTLYWCQLAYRRNVSCSIAIWSVVGSVYTYIGTSILALGNQPAVNIYPPGNYHAATSPGTPYVYISNLIGILDTEPVTNLMLP